MSEKTVSPAERGTDMKGLEGVPPRSVWGIDERDSFIPHQNQRPDLEKAEKLKHGAGKFRRRLFIRCSKAPADRKSHSQPEAPPAGAFLPG